MAERILCSIPVQRSRLFRLPQNFALVVTERRTILVPVSRSAFAEAGRNARERARTEGKGFFGRWGAQIQAILGYAQRYLTMDPEAILLENPTSRAVENGSVLSVRLQRSEDEDGNTSAWKLSVRTRDGRMKLVLQAEPEGFREALRQAYTDRFRD